VPNSTSTGIYLTYTIPPSKLLSGTNIVAIEVHQSSLNSSDLILDCELIASFEAPLEMSISRLGSGSVLYWFNAATILEQTLDLSSGWAPVAGAQSPLSLDLGE